MGFLLLNIKILSTTVKTYFFIKYRMLLATFGTVIKNTPVRPECNIMRQHYLHEASV